MTNIIIYNLQTKRAMQYKRFTFKQSFVRHTHICIGFTMLYVFRILFGLHFFDPPKMLENLTYGS